MTIAFLPNQPDDAPVEHCGRMPFQARVVSALPGVILRGGLQTNVAFLNCGNRYGADVALLLRDKTRDELLGIARIYGYATDELLARVGQTEADRLIDIAARAFGVTRPQIRGESRRQRVVMARFFVMHWLYRRTGMSLPAIGRRFNHRDHTTVLNATIQWPRKRHEARRARALIRRGEPINYPERVEYRAAETRLARYAEMA